MDGRDRVHTISLETKRQDFSPDFPRPIYLFSITISAVWILTIFHEKFIPGNFENHYIGKSKNLTPIPFQNMVREYILDVN